MTEQLSLNKKDNNFQSFKQSLNNFLESLAKEDLSSNLKQLPLPPSELFELLDEHFTKFHDITNLNAILLVIYRSLVELLKTQDNLSSDFNIKLLIFLEQHINEESDIVIAVQIIYTLLKIIKIIDSYKVIQISKEIFVRFTIILTTTKNRDLISAILSSLQLYIEMYPDNRKDILQNLWSNLSQQLVEQTSTTVFSDNKIDILTQLNDRFNEIHQIISEDPNIINTIQYLLRSEIKDNRKCAYYLGRKILRSFKTDINETKFEKFWTTMEILDGDASPENVIPYLNDLKEIIQSNKLPTSWLDILYTRLLAHDKIDVLYWTMELLLETYTYQDLSFDTIKQLLKASNCMRLYNPEGCFLQPNLFKHFLKGDLRKLYELMVNMEWRSIPLYIWIKAIYENEIELNSTTITPEQILNITSRVNNVQNKVLCREITYLVRQLFGKVVNELPNKEYITFIESLDNIYIYFEKLKGNTFNDLYFETFYSKIITQKTSEMEFIFSQSIYLIFIRNIDNDCFNANDFINFLQKLPKKLHGWLRFVPFYIYDLLDDVNLQKLNTLCDIDLPSLKLRKLSEIIVIFEQKFLLDPLPGDENLDSVLDCRLAAIIFYIQQKSSFDLEDEETLKIVFDSEISEYNSEQKFPKLWHHLYNCLKNTNKRLETWIINEFLKRLSVQTQGFTILEYLSKTYEDIIKNKYFKIILEQYPEIFYEFIDLNLKVVNPLKLSNQDQLFCCDLGTDELRIEKLFCNQQFYRYSTTPMGYLKLIWFHALENYGDEEYVLYLLNYHKDLDKKVSVLNEEFKKHDLKFRIALGILHIRNTDFYNTKIFNEIWNILLNEQTQLNICYIYEYILGSYDTRVDTILENLKQAQTLSSRQKMSIISVAYTHCMLKSLAQETMETIISNLVSLTKYSNSDSGILAKMALYNLLKTEKFEKILNRQQIMQSIDQSLETKLMEYSHDFRLHMHKQELSRLFLWVILFVTKPKILDPFFVHAYEISSKMMRFTYWGLSSQIQEQVKKCREVYLEQLDRTAIAAETLAS